MVGCRASRAPLPRALGNFREDIHAAEPEADIAFKGDPISVAIRVPISATREDPNAVALGILNSVATVPWTSPISAPGRYHS